jgi:hypothetical protein
VYNRRATAAYVTDEWINDIALDTERVGCHGLEKQIVDYGKAEKTDRLIYLVVEVQGTSRRKMIAFKRVLASQKSPYPKVVMG